MAEDKETEEKLRKKAEEIFSPDFGEEPRDERMEKDIQQLKKDVLALSTVDPEAEDAELEAKLVRAIKIARKQVSSHHLTSYSGGNSQEGLVVAHLAAAVLARMK